MENEKLHYIDMLKLQYERIVQHENQRLTFRGLVLTITSAVFTVFISLNSNFSSADFLFMMFFLIIINIFACIFVHKSRGWIKFHQRRARFILQSCNPDLMKAVYNDEKGKSNNSKETAGVLNNTLPPLKIDSNYDRLKRPGL